jgi:autotransporter-associated beta strand protein
LSNVWDVNGVNNWTLINALTATNYQEDLVTYSTTDQVLFDDSASGAGAISVNVSTTVSPSAITFNNDSRDYTFTGTGAIAGGSPVTKVGTGTATLANAGGVTLGNIAINAGTLRLGDNATSGAGNGTTGSISIASGATLSINRIDNSTFNGVISGAGSVVHSGSGTSTFSATNTYTGTTDISNGTIRATSNASLGALPGGTVTITSTGSLDVGGFATADSANFGQKQFNISGAGPGSGVGVLTNSSTANRQINAFQKVTLTANASVGGPGRFDVRAPSGSPGSAVLDLAGFTLTKVGTGMFALVRADATSGDILVTEGILNIEQSSNVPAGGTITYQAGTTAQFNNPTGNVSRNMVMNGNTVFDANQTAAPNIASPISFGASTTFNIAASSGFTFSGGISESSQSGITKTGTGTVVFSGTLGYTGATDVTAGRMVLENSVNSSSVNVADGATLEVAAGGGSNRVLKAGSVSVPGTGKINLQDNKLVTASPIGSWNGSNYTDITGLVASGRNGGVWDGSGITTTQSDATSGSGYTSLGVALGSEVKGIGPSDTETWGGQTITGSDALVMYTYGGDANLSGNVDIDDYGQIDFNSSIGGILPGWYNGDFDYNGAVDIDDYGVIDFVIGIQGAPFPTGSGAGLSVAAVPEPASLAIIGLAATGLLARRRRRN